MQTIHKEDQGDCVTVCLKYLLFVFNFLFWVSKKKSYTHSNRKGKESCTLACFSGSSVLSKIDVVFRLIQCFPKDFLVMW